MSIRVTPIPVYLPKKSSPSDNRYVFSYTIEILNEGHETAKLLGRHWFVRDAKEQLQEVQGQGVVGEQPSIAPGASYRYTSGTILETETGTMEGHYEFISESGEQFQVPIPLFVLAPPSQWH